MKFHLFQKRGRNNVEIFICWLFYMIFFLQWLLGARQSVLVSLVLTKKNLGISLREFPMWSVTESLVRCKLAARFELHVAPRTTA